MLSTPAQTTNYNVHGPFRTPSNDVRYVFSSKPILVTPLQSDRSLGVQGTMQARVAEVAPGLVQQSEQVQYIDSRGRPQSTRNYIASSFLQYVNDVSKQFEKASSGKGGYAARYELSPRKEDDTPHDESIAVAVLDIDGDASANRQLLSAMRKEGYVEDTPMLDASMEVHDADQLERLSVFQERMFPEEATKIMKVVVEAFLQTLAQELASCPVFDEFEFNPRIFSSCYDSKISFHAIIRVFATDMQGNRAEVVFGSIKDLKPLYKRYISEHFGEPHLPDMPHPFLTKPDETWTAAQIKRRNNSVAWLLKNNKTPVVECAGDAAIATPNRVIRGVGCSKLGRKAPKLFYLLGDNGKWYACHLFDNKPEGPLTTDIYNEEGPYWDDLGYIRHFLMGSVLYMSPEKPHYILSSNSQVAQKRRARVSARKARTSPSNFEITVPDTYTPFDESFDVEKFCGDLVANITDFYRTNHNCDAHVSKCKVSATAERIVVEMRTAGVTPCAIKKATHNSNNFYMIVTREYESWRVVQHCFAAPCKSKCRSGVFMRDISEDIVFDDYVDTTHKQSLQELFGVVSDEDEEDMSNFTEYIGVQLAKLEQEQARCTAEKEIEPEAEQLPPAKKNKKSVSGGKHNVAAGIQEVLTFFGSN